MVDFHGKEFMASAFSFQPYSFVDNKNGKHSGFEYKIARELSTALNLDMKVDLPTDKQWWGNEIAPGNWSGGFVQCTQKQVFSFLFRLTQ